MLVQVTFFIFFDSLKSFLSISHLLYLSDMGWPHRLHERLKHVTWAWFSATMGTGSLALMIYQTPYQFRGLITIGTIIFIIDLIQFFICCSLLIARFIIVPKIFFNSLQHPIEAFYIGTFLVSLSLILQNVSQYGSPSCGPWLQEALQVCFWLYTGFATLFAVYQYYALFVSQRLETSKMVPAWILPIYPLLVTGPLAGVLLASQPTPNAVPIFVGGVLAQGLGWMIATFLYVIWFLRLFSADLPPPSARPGMYIAVGPTGFTAQALLTLGSRCPRILSQNFLGASGVPAGEILRVLGTIAGMFLWLLSFWYFCISTLAVAKGGREMKFSLQWWGFVFPNVGMVVSAIQIGNVLDSPGIKWVTCVAVAILFVAWVLVTVGHVRAVWLRQIAWDGKDEDAGMEFARMN